MEIKHWINLTLLLVAAGLVFQAAGLVTPLWVFLSSGDNNMAIGLFYRVGCDSDNGTACSGIVTPPFEYNSDKTFNKKEWDAVLILQAIATGTSGLLFLMFIVYSIGFGIWPKMEVLNWVMFFTAIITWAVITAGLIVFGVAFNSILMDSPKVSTRSFSWSFIMCLVAGVIFVIVTVLIRLCCRERIYSKTAIPTSTDSKLALNPSTKNQLLKQYFAPAPYRDITPLALTEDGSTQEKVHVLNTTTPSLPALDFPQEFGPNRYLQPSRYIEYPTRVIKEENPYTFNKMIETSYLPVGSTVPANVSGINGRPLTSNVYDPGLGFSNGGQDMHVITRMENRVLGSSALERRLPEPSSHYRSFEELGVSRRSVTQQRQTPDYFRDNEGETIFYRGKYRADDMRAGSEDVYQRFVHGNGMIPAGQHHQQLMLQQQPAQRLYSQSYPNLVAPEPRVNPVPDNAYSYRMRADHIPNGGSRRDALALPYTVHTRNEEPPVRASSAALAPHEKGQYKNTYVYRPYPDLY